MAAVLGTSFLVNSFLPCVLLLGACSALLSSHGQRKITENAIEVTTDPILDLAFLWENVTIYLME